MSRFSVTILLLFFIIFLPWWVNLIFLVGAIMFFPWYYEGVFVALLYELLYGLNNSNSWTGSVLWLTLGVLIFIPIVEWFKKRLYVFH